LVPHGRGWIEAFAGRRALRRSKNIGYMFDLHAAISLWGAYVWSLPRYLIDGD
jgi:hypothetical protein